MTSNLAQYGRDMSGDPDSKTAACTDKGDDSPILASLENGEAVALAKTMGFSEPCMKDFESLNRDTLETMNKSGFGVGVSANKGAGSIGGALNFNYSQEDYTRTINEHDTRLQEKGCGQMFGSMNKILKAASSLTCYLDDTINETNVVQHIRADVNVEIRALSGKVGEKAEKTRQKAQKDLSDFLMRQEELGYQQLAKPAAEKDANYFAQLNLLELAGKERRLTFERAIKGSGAAGSFSGSTLETTQNIGTNIKVDQNVQMITAEQIETNMKEVAETMAKTKMEQIVGYGGTSPEMREFVNQQIASDIKSQANNIITKMTNMKVNQEIGGGISILIEGPVIDSNITVSQNMIVDTQVSQIIETAMDFGNSVVYDMLSKAVTDVSFRGEVKGLEDYIKQIGDNNEKIMAELRQSRKEQMEGAGKAVGNVIGSIGDAFMKNAIVGIIAAIAVPVITGTGAIPGPVKIILIAVIAYFVAAYFMKFWPFNEKENKISRQTWKDGASYQLRRKKNKSPYGGLKGLPVGGEFRM